MKCLNRLLVVAIISISLILSSCNSSKIVDGDYYVFGQDDQTLFEKSPLLDMAESEDGYYFFGGPDNDFLYFLDKSTMKSMILCNKPDCLHTDETDPEKISNCNACLYNEKSNLIYYNSYLYALGNDDALYQISLDGTKRKKILTFREKPYSFIIHRGYLYYTTNDHGTIAGNETNTVTTCKLYRINLNKPDKGNELLYERTGIYEYIIKVVGYGKSIYLYSFCYKTASLEETDSGLFRYDLISQKTTQLLENTGNFSIYENKLLFLDIKSGKYCIMDLTSSEIKEIGVFNGYVIFDGKYIYCDTLPVETQKREMIMYDLNGVELDRVNLDLCGKDLVYGGDSDYLFIPDNHANSNNYGEIKSLWVIDKSEISKRQIELKKIYEFIPTFRFPGIITSAN